MSNELGDQRIEISQDFWQALREGADSEAFLQTRMGGTAVNLPPGVLGQQILKTHYYILPSRFLKSKSDWLTLVTIPFGEPVLSLVALILMLRDKLETMTGAERSLVLSWIRAAKSEGIKPYRLCINEAEALHLSVDWSPELVNTLLGKGILESCDGDRVRLNKW